MSRALSPYCCTPLVVTDLRLTVPPAFVVRLARSVSPPTSSAKIVSPVELATSAKVPSTSFVNVMVPLPVETVVLAASVVIPITVKTLFVVA